MRLDPLNDTDVGVHFISGEGEGDISPRLDPTEDLQCVPSLVREEKGQGMDLSHPVQSAFRVPPVGLRG